MKSLSPDAYINEDRDQKPTHISPAISEVLNQVGPTAKPTTGASMTEPVPEERSQTNAPTPPARSPGRPRKTRINSVNIDTDLELDERFCEFCEITGATEPEALLSIFALYKYAARHCAVEGSVAGINSEKLAKRCYWTKDATLFVEALQKSGFLSLDNLDRQIVDWHETQPHAKEYARKRKYYKDKKHSDLT